MGAWLGLSRGRCESKKSFSCERAQMTSYEDNGDVQGVHCVVAVPRK